MRFIPCAKIAVTSNNRRMINQSKPRNTIMDGTDWYVVAISMRQLTGNAQGLGRECRVTEGYVLAPPITNSSAFNGMPRMLRWLAHHVSEANGEPKGDCGIKWH